MPKPYFRFEAADGSLFGTFEEAAKHERRIEEIQSLTLELSNGCGSNVWDWEPAVVAEWLLDRYILTEKKRV